MLEIRWMTILLVPECECPWADMLTYWHPVGPVCVWLWMCVDVPPAVGQHSSARGHKNRPHHHCRVPAVLWCQNQLQGQGRYQFSSVSILRVIISISCPAINEVVQHSGRRHSPAWCCASQQIQDSEAARSCRGRHKTKQSCECFLLLMLMPSLAWRGF